MKHRAREIFQRFLRSPHRDTVTIVVLAVVLLSAMSGVAPHRNDDPAVVVNEFLQASQQGDVDRALELAGQQRPKGEEGAFLTPKASASNWSVDRIATVSWDDHLSGTEGDGRREEALVEFDIKLPHHSKTSGSIAIGREVGESTWEFMNPLTSASIPYTPLWYSELNGELADAMAPNRDESSQSYLLLPGVYTLHSHTSGLVNVTDNTTPVFPQQHEHNVDSNAPETKEFPEPTVRLTADGRATVKKEVKAHIDDCATKDEPETYGCPFAADPVSVETSDGHYLDDVSDVSWSIKEYPKVAVVAGSESFDVTDRRRGAATLKVKSENDKTVECEIRTSSLELGFNKDDSIRIVPDGERFEKQDQLPGDFETCSR